jgi:hypothetical protein
MLDSFLNDADSARVARTFQKLAVHDISRLVLTGGIAIELHILRRGGQAAIRRLHDIDFLTESFASIPGALGAKLQLCHVHPSDLPGKNIFQAVDPETDVRIDVFRACGSELERTLPVTIAGCAFQMASLQDIVARHARLKWDLMENKPVAPKYARDFLRLLDYVEADEVDSVWREHRKPQCPDTFADAAQQLRRVIASRSELLIPPAYSTDVNEVCKRCEGAKAFPLADRGQILTILGYC